MRNQEGDIVGNAVITVVSFASSPVQELPTFQELDRTKNCLNSANTEQEHLQEPTESKSRPESA